MAGLNVNQRSRQLAHFVDNSPQGHSFRTSDDIAIELGRNLNQRYACYLMFSLVFDYPSILKESWKYVSLHSLTLGYESLHFLDRT